MIVLQNKGSDTAGVEEPGGLFELSGYVHKCMKKITFPWSDSKNKEASFSPLIYLSKSFYMLVLVYICYMPTSIIFSASIFDVWNKVNSTGNSAL